MGSGGGDGGEGDGSRGRPEVGRGELEKGGRAEKEEGRGERGRNGRSGTDRHIIYMNLNEVAPSSNAIVHIYKPDCKPDTNRYQLYPICSVSVPQRPANGTSIVVANTN